MSVAAAHSDESTDRIAYLVKYRGFTPRLVRAWDETDAAIEGLHRSSRQDFGYYPGMYVAASRKLEWVRCVEGDPLYMH